MVRTNGLLGYSDVHFTDRDVARRIVTFFRPTLPCLEPFAGEGSFLDFLPAGTDWCELSRGRNFLDYTGRVQWIVTNPPFERLTFWLEKAFAIADNVVFLMPLSKLFSSAPRLSLVETYGNVRTVLYLGTGRRIGFNIGFPFAVIHFQKGWRGDTRWVWSGQDAIAAQVGQDHPFEETSVGAHDADQDEFDEPDRGAASSPDQDDCKQDDELRQGNVAVHRLTFD